MYLPTSTFDLFYGASPFDRIVFDLAHRELEVSSKVSGEVQFDIDVLSGCVPPSDHTFKDILSQNDSLRKPRWSENFGTAIHIPLNHLGSRLFLMCGKTARTVRREQCWEHILSLPRP